MKKKMTFALCFCNRGFMPGELIYGARDDMVKAVTDAGYDYIMMDKELTRYGGVETRDEGLLYAKWLKEHDEASLLYAGEELISIEPQMFVELECTHTEPGFKGDTATNTTKPATFETGVELQVPTFVEIGDVLQIDTRDGRVIKRV